MRHSEYSLQPPIQRKVRCRYTVMQFSVIACDDSRSFEAGVEFKIESGAYSV
jgi:hypothetical protein